MIFNKEETKNLINMLRSADKENAIVAFESLNNVDPKKYIGELIVLFKFGQPEIEQWEQNCEACANALNYLVKDLKKDKLNTYNTGQLLSMMTDNKASHESIELFMEFFTENMIGFLSQMGYPTDKFEINIKLKK